MEGMPLVVHCAKVFVHLLQIAGCRHASQQPPIYLFLFIKIATNDSEPLLFGHLEIVGRDLSHRWSTKVELLEPMMEEEMGNGFSGDVTILSCMCRHHMSQEMS